MGWITRLGERQALRERSTNALAAMTSLERAKDWLEILAIVFGVLVAGVLAHRHWAHPSAELSLTNRQRTTTSSYHDHLIVDIQFRVGDANWIEVNDVLFACDADRDCDGQCEDLESTLRRGPLAAGDAFNWSCKFLVPATGCTSLTMEVAGSAGAPSFGRSRWSAKTISCAAIDQTP